MRALHWHRERFVLGMISASALLHTLPAKAQSDAVTQFAPLDESPIPTAPSAPPSSAPAAAGEATPAQTPRPAPNSAAPFVSSTPNTPTTPEVPAQAAAQTPFVGSTWLAAPTTAAAPVVNNPATPPHPEPATTVVDSGLPAFAPASRRGPNQDVVSEATDQEPETHRVAATFSLARAFLLPAVLPNDVKDAALYEGTIEVKVFERFSLAVMGGLGSFDIPLSQLGENVHVTGKELGGQARVYLFGDFDHGLSIGGEYLRVWAEADPINVEAIPPPPLPPGTGLLTGEATLSGLGGFVGYKIIASFGLTFDAKLGVQHLTADGKGTVSGEIGPGYPTLTESESFHFEQLVPLVNVNVGWAI